MEALINSPLFNICNVNLHKASHDNGTKEKKKNNKHKVPLTNYNPIPVHSDTKFQNIPLFFCYILHYIHVRKWNATFCGMYSSN